MKSSKRELLRLAGLAITAGMAGCQTTGGDGDDDSETTHKDGFSGSAGTNTTRAENREATAKFLSTDPVATLPIVRPDTIDDVARVEVEISDPDGLQTVAVAYSDDYRDEPLLVADKTASEAKTGANGQTIQFTGEFPRRVVAPSTGEFVVEVTDANGNSVTRTESIETETRGWKVDRGDGAYQTERAWDDLAFDRDEFYDEHVSEWQKEAVYSAVIRQLGLNNLSKYNGDHESRFYSNSEYRRGNEDGFGFWDKGFYEELTQLNNILEDAQSAIHTFQSDVHPTAYSAWNYRFAATLEDIVHNFNAEAREHLEETGRKAVHAGHVNEAGHGTVITYSDLENTDIEAAHSWQFVDTTAAVIVPVNEHEEINTGGNYNPFVEGYETGSQADMTYRGGKNIASAGLFSFISAGEANEADFTKVSISDSILDDVFDAHVPSEGSIYPILDIVERVTVLQIDTGNYIHVYGERLDEYETAVTRDETLYEKSMTRGTQVTADEVAAYLTDSSG